MLLGSISSQYEGQKIAFALGAISASFLFFFTLAMARLLRPLFAQPKAWRVLTCWWPWRCSVSAWDCLSESR